jgi:hypothetical protein
VKYGLRQNPQILAFNGGAGGSRGSLEGLGGPCSYHAGLVSWTVGGVFPGLESSEWCLVRGGKGDGGERLVVFLARPGPFLIAVWCGGVAG